MMYVCRWYGTQARGFRTDLQGALGRGGIELSQVVEGEGKGLFVAGGWGVSGEFLGLRIATYTFLPMVRTIGHGKGLMAALRRGGHDMGLAAPWGSVVRVSPHGRPHGP